MIAGIIPGIHGAVALVSDEGELHAVVDMPLEDAPGRLTTYRPRVLLKELASLIRHHSPKRAVVERLMPSPNRSLKQVFGFGHEAGALAGILAALDVRATLTILDNCVASYALPSDRADAREIAARLWPSTTLIQRTAHAEAALLALYGAGLRAPAQSNVTAFRKAIS